MSRRRRRRPGGPRRRLPSRPAAKAIDERQSRPWLLPDENWVLGARSNFPAAQVSRYCKPECGFSDDSFCRKTATSDWFFGARGLPSGGMSKGSLAVSLSLLLAGTFLGGCSSQPTGLIINVDMAGFDVDEL